MDHVGSWRWGRSEAENEKDRRLYIGNVVGWKWGWLEMDQINKSSYGADQFQHCSQMESRYILQYYVS